MHKPLRRHVAFLLLLGSFGGSCHKDRDDGVDLEGQGRCITDTECATGRRCIAGRCAKDYGTCKGPLALDDCQNDTYCACPPEVSASSCVCIPWGEQPKGDRDPLCSGQAFAPEAFENPVLKCEWPPKGAPAQAVLTTPLVADLDRDGTPEILFHTASGIGTGGHLIALSGKDCSVKFDVGTTITGCTHLAVADLDGDGSLEIVAQAPGITVYDRNGTKRASVLGPGLGLCSVDFPPAIANIDGVGPPEIIAGGHVSRFLTGPDRLEVLFQVPGNEGSWGTVSVPVDLDGDGVMEVALGSRVVDGLTGKDKTPSVMKGMKGGYPAVGDFNNDGHPDLVLLSSQKPEMGQGGQTLQIIDYRQNRLLMEPAYAPLGWGGPPTVADFDGDGRPEVAAASAVSYSVYSPDCMANPKPAKCMGQDEGVLWQVPTQDDSSGSTGSSVFDFNGDGAAEVVYRDECWLRVYGGKSGKTLFAAAVTSGTDLELPVIADTDADGHAEIVVSSTPVSPGFCAMRSGMELGMKHPGSTSGVKVYMDPKNRWMPSRSMWNQHAYYVTNINDDGSVPTKEPSNVKLYNNFRANLQGMGRSAMPTGDATGKVLVLPDEGDCVNLWRLHATLCNRGAADLPMGLPGSFYKGEPGKGGVLLCTARTKAKVAPGACEAISCEWQNPDRGPVDLWFRANDDGKGRVITECKEGNGLASFGRRSCLSLK